MIHYGWGVPAFVLIKVLAPGYFAREDTKTPMRFALMTVALNTALGAGLFLYFKSQGWAGFPGLAIATSISAWVNAAFLFFGLRAKGWYIAGPHLAKRLTSVTAASLTMGAGLYFALQNKTYLADIIPFGKFAEVVVFILFGILVYAVAALVFGAIKISDLKGMLRRAPADTDA